ncbi:MAG: manganese efflux pump MntP family protein [bacterium]|nr:manganese efflux pump MntP family protein [bacterium]
MPTVTLSVLGNWEGNIDLELINVIALAFALAFDAFGVAVAVGVQLGELDRWTVFRLSFHFGFAQFGMPIIGWLAGGEVVGLVGSLANWLAFIVLLAIGGRLIWEQIRPEERKWKGDPTRGASLLILMFATSVDALAAGFTLALVGSQILMPTLMIGVVAAAMTILGLIFGRTMGLKFGRIAGVIGGVILIGLAVKAVLF